MSRANDHPVVVGEQNRRAIGGQNAEQQVGRIGHHCIGTRSLALGPRTRGDDDVGRMDLMDRGQLRLRIKGCDGQAAVSFDCFGIVIAAEADVEAGTFAHGNSAASAEEPVRQLPQADRTYDLDVVQSTFRMMMSSSA